MIGPWTPGTDEPFEVAADGKTVVAPPPDPDDGTVVPGEALTGVMFAPVLEMTR